MNCLNVCGENQKTLNSRNISEMLLLWWNVIARKKLRSPISTFSFKFSRRLGSLSLWGHTDFRGSL